MKEIDKALSGLAFKQGDPELKKKRDKAASLCFKLNNTDPLDYEKRSEILNELIKDHKDNFKINSPFYCDYGEYITLGENFFANYDTKILDGGRVIFGDDVRIGPSCTFVTVTHSLDTILRKEGYQQFKPVIVGNNVWFGANVTVLPGVIIGDNAVIAAGSVVTKDIPSNVLAAGVPCKVIKNI